jgi:hypothetical protein
MRPQKLNCAVTILRYASIGDVARTGSASVVDAAGASSLFEQGRPMDFEEVIGMLLIGSVLGGVALLMTYTGFIL